MDSPATKSDLVGAVELVDAVFNRGRVIVMADWDDMLLTLVDAHNLCGGAVRSGVRALFAASYENGDSVRSAVACLSRALRDSACSAGSINTSECAHPPSTDPAPPNIQLELDLGQ